MKYVIPQLFFMIHLCNILMPAASKHRLKGINYDVDEFVSQLLTSWRFEELVEKLTEKATNSINYNKKFFFANSDEKNVKGTNKVKHDVNGFITQVLASKNAHEVIAKFIVTAGGKINANSDFRARAESSHEEPPKTNQVDNAEMKEESTEKINLQDFSNESLPLGKNLKYKYDYIKNKLLKDNDSDSSTTVQRKERKTKKEKQGSSHEQIHFYEPVVHESHNKHRSKHRGTTGFDNKTGGRTYKHNVNGKNKGSSKKKTNDENEPSREDANNHYGKKDSIIYNKTSLRYRSGTGGDDNENSKENYDSVVAQSASQEHIHSSEAQNAELMVKEKLKTIRKNKRIIEEESSSVSEENYYIPPSKQKTKQEVKKTKNHSTDEKVEDENAGDIDSIKSSEMISDENLFFEGYGNKSSEDSGDYKNQERPLERSLEDPRSKERSDEDQVKPVIRNEGGKLYTYVQNPDYAEVNEDMAKWQKTNPEETVDFM